MDKKIRPPPYFCLKVVLKMAKKITWSLKTKTHVCPQPYGSAVVQDAAVSEFIGILQNVPLANNGRYQIATVDQEATEGQIELPASGPSDAVEYSASIKCRGALNDAWVNLPGMSTQNTSSIESALDTFAKAGKLLSRDGSALGDVSNTTAYSKSYSVKAAAYNGGGGGE